jgi:hypothetical protein
VVVVVVVSGESFMVFPEPIHHCVDLFNPLDVMLAQFASVVTCAVQSLYVGLNSVAGAPKSIFRKSVFTTIVVLIQSNLSD